MAHPLLTLRHALVGAARSTTFLSTFVAAYMATISIHRKLFKGDFKLLYWLAGTEDANPSMKTLFLLLANVQIPVLKYLTRLL